MQEHHAQAAGADQRMLGEPEAVFRASPACRVIWIRREGKKCPHASSLWPRGGSRPIGDPPDRSLRLPLGHVGGIRRGRLGGGDPEPAAAVPVDAEPARPSPEIFTVPSASRSVSTFEESRAQREAVVGQVHLAEQRGRAVPAVHEGRSAGSSTGRSSRPAPTGWSPCRGRRCPPGRRAPACRTRCTSRGSASPCWNGRSGTTGAGRRCADHPDAPVPGHPHELHEIAERAQPRIHAVEIGDVVAVVTASWAFRLAGKSWANHSGPHPEAVRTRTSICRARNAAR
jgi:hypothetical protein